MILPRGLKERTTLPLMGPLDRDERAFRGVVTERGNSGIRDTAPMTKHSARRDTDTKWYAVRCVIASMENKPWGPTDLKAGETAYEDRITLWRAASADDAIALAEAEAEEHADTIESEYLGLAQSYHLAEKPKHGAEVFSLIRRSVLDPESYLTAFFDTGDEYEAKV